jgi:hypothetical protein
MIRVPHDDEELAFPCPCPECLAGREDELRWTMTVWQECRYVLYMAFLVVATAAADLWSAVRRVGGWA